MMAEYFKIVSIRNGERASFVWPCYICYNEPGTETPAPPGTPGILIFKYMNDALAFMSSHCFVMAVRKVEIWTCEAENPSPFEENGFPYGTYEASSITLKKCILETHYHHELENIDWAPNWRRWTKR